MSQKNSGDSCFCLSNKINGSSLSLISHGLSIKTLRNHLVGGRSTPCKKKASDSNYKMITMAWSLVGFHVIDVLRKQKIFSPMKHVEHIMEYILALRLNSGWHCFVVHAGNSSAQTISIYQTFYD
jgi:hypothetical protein